MRVTLVDGPVPNVVAFEGDGDPIGRVGAQIAFDGVVRAREGVALIDALTYQVYEPMATRQLERLGQELCEKHGLLAVQVWHSRGRVPVGACSFRLVVQSEHRAEGLAAMSEFIDRMKRDVPIWKV